MNKDGPGLEPRHIDTLDENAVELPSGEAVPLNSPRLNAAEGNRRRKLLRAAFDRYRIARAMLRRTGTDDAPISEVQPIQPINPVRPVRGFRRLL